MDGAGPQKRGVSLRAAANCSFTLGNTGAADSVDIYRLSATADGGEARLANALAAVTAGQTQEVPVYSVGTARTMTLRAQSESDPTKSATATCNVRR